MTKKNLFIGSLAYATNDETLREFFSQIGEVEYAKVMTDRDTGRSRGFGFVTFVNEEDNKKAVEQLDGKDLDGRAINVSEARPREERPRDNDRGGRDNDRGNSNGGGSFRQRSW